MILGFPSIDPGRGGQNGEVSWFHFLPRQGIGGSLSRSSGITELERSSEPLHMGIRLSACS
jgi:hypothetical protein